MSFDKTREELSVRLEKAILVAVALPDRPFPPGDPLEELRGLAETAGARVVDELTQKRHEIQLGTYIGTGKVKELVDLASDGRPLVADLRESLASDNACRRAQADGQAIVDDLLENHWLGSTPPPWLTGSWLDALIRGAALDFDAALRRWRELLEAVDSQFAQAQKDLANHALSERERQAADQRQRAARLQQQLLLADKPGSSNNNDFSTYRYLASQGFMPGYNFPRLPRVPHLPRLPCRPRRPRRSAGAGAGADPHARASGDAGPGFGSARPLRDRRTA